MEIEDLGKRFDRIEYLIERQCVIQKEVLTSQEAAQYLELSTSHLYKLTSGKQIPCYCPQGKRLYFKRSELDQWLLRNRQATMDELNEAAEAHISGKISPSSFKNRAPKAQFANKIQNYGETNPE